jgi:hypothetical protein
MNRENLKKLADGLRGPLRAEFSMRHFVKSKYFDWTNEEKVTALPPSSPECSTVACAAGHATYLIESKWPGEGFIEYTCRVFGIHVDSDEWDWVFGMYWRFTDDSPIGAADRIDWLLEHGLPEDSEDQMNGITPLCYRRKS